MRRSITVSALAAALLVLTVGIAVAAVNRTITLTHSASFPTASGSSQFQSQGTQRELQVEVEHIKVLSGKKVNVFVNGAKWATLTVSSLGKAQVDRNTDVGQAVPKIAAGSTVRVRTLGGTLIASGSY